MIWNYLIDKQQKKKQNNIYFRGQTLKKLAWLPILMAYIEKQEIEVIVEDKH